MSRSTQRGNWNKSEFQRLRIAFERGEPRTEPAGASEDESGNLPSRRRYSFTQLFARFAA